MPPPPPALRPPPPAPAPAQPVLGLRTLDRGDGLLGLRPCGPVRPPARVPLFGARGPQLSLAWLDWRPAGARPSPAQQAAAEARLQRLGLHPLPMDALQWRGPPPAIADLGLPASVQPRSLVRESDFGAFWAEALPALRAEGWAIDQRPGFAHAALPVAGWQLKLEPLDGPGGLGAWLLGLTLSVLTREGPETLDLVPMLGRLLKSDGRWRDADALAAIPDDALIRLVAPGGRVIDAEAAPLKAIVGQMLDLLGHIRVRRGDGRLELARWEAARLAALRSALSGPPGQPLPPWALEAPAEAWAWLQHNGLLEPAPRGCPPVAPPDGLGLQLRPYQLHGLAWLQRLASLGAGGILADDMGLGKTAQALAHLLLEKQSGRLDRPALVVAPASLLFNWQAEAARVAPGLRLLLLAGPGRHALHAQMAHHDLVLTSYPLLWRDALPLRRQPWHLVLLDEAQMVKNAGSRAATAARRLEARHRLCLTGTPIENHLGELWSQMQFLIPGFLGDARSFQRDWRTPIEKNGETLRARLLAARLAPFLLRRRKAEVAAELPPITEQVQRVALDGAQRQLYESLRLACDRNVRQVLDTHGLGPAMPTVLDALLRLRQVCNDPRLVHGIAPDGSGGPGGPDAQRGEAGAGVAVGASAGSGASAKMEWLAATLPTLVAGGHRVLVFSQFTSMLTLVAAELRALGIAHLALTGDTPTAQREAVVARFQAGAAPVLLASLKAGGTGLNLTAADTVLLLDPWWNPAVEAQAAARAHRIGQQRPVLVWRLVAAGSIEERMLALQQRKARLAGTLLDLAAGGEGALTPDEVVALLAPLDDGR